MKCKICGLDKWGIVDMPYLMRFGVCHNCFLNNYIEKDELEK